MTKALCSFHSEKEKREVAKRRVSKKSGGLGYWGAYDALNRTGVSPKKEEKVESQES